MEERIRHCFHVSLARANDGVCIAPPSSAVDAQPAVTLAPKDSHNIACNFNVNATIVASGCIFDT